MLLVQLTGMSWPVHVSIDQNGASQQPRILTERVAMLEQVMLLRLWHSGLLQQRNYKPCWPRMLHP